MSTIRKLNGGQPFTMEDVNQDFFDCIRTPALQTIRNQIIPAGLRLPMVPPVQQHVPFDHSDSWPNLDAYPNPNNSLGAVLGFRELWVTAVTFPPPRIQRPRGSIRYKYAINPS